MEQNVLVKCHCSWHIKILMFCLYNFGTAFLYGKFLSKQIFGSFSYMIWFFESMKTFQNYSCNNNMVSVKSYWMHWNYRNYPLKENVTDLYEKWGNLCLIVTMYFTDFQKFLYSNILRRRSCIWVKKKGEGKMEKRRWVMGEKTSFLLLLNS